jgi:DDE family transposase
VKDTTSQKLARRKRRISKRLRSRNWRACKHPMLTARNIRYQSADRDRGICHGGIGAVHLLARKVGLIDALDTHVHLLKTHLPYHESDHVLNIAYNILCGGECLEDLEALRNDEVYLDALGASRIPDPTTAGDFCRRFQKDRQVLQLMETINEVRLGVWKQQPQEFFACATIDADGTIAPTTGQCKGGMNISYDGQWGYHPLLISLANTKEPLYLVNRPGNRPSHEQADEYLDKAITLCRRAGFKSIVLRGDTDFMQSWKLDEWDRSGDITFVFGTNAYERMIQRAESLGTTEWKRLERPRKYAPKTEPRAKPDNIREQIVVEKGFKNFLLKWEDVAEFAHRPHLCKQAYRIVVLRKKISVEKGQTKLFEEYAYFFYITNDRTSTPEQIVFAANDRCDQENLIEQLKNRVRSMRNPLDNLHSNWAYMVIASLAWTLKAFWGLMLPSKKGRWHPHHEQQKRDLVKMEFKRFVNNLIRLPCQIIKTGRRLVYRLLSYNPWQSALLRGVVAWRTRTQC